MALLETDPTLSTGILDPTLVQGAVYFTENSEELPIPDLEVELEARFDKERVDQLAEQYLVEQFGPEWRNAVGDRNFVVGVMPATSEYADAAKMIETTKFARRFKRHPSRVFEEYEAYNEVSTFLIAIDVSGEQPTPAGTLRIIEPNETKGMKSINDLVEDKPGNPWIDEIKAGYFGEDENYDAAEAWIRLCQRVGVELDPDESFDVATISVLDKYGTDGSIDGTSIALYHSCLRYALGNGIKNLVSIQDLVPLKFLQQYGDCFSLFEDLQPHPYGGPYDTIPAWAELQEGMRRVRSSGFGGIFIEGEGIDQDYYLLKDYSPEQYSDQAVGLGSYRATE